MSLLHQISDPSSPESDSAAYREQELQVPFPEVTTLGVLSGIMNVLLPLSVVFTEPSKMAWHVFTDKRNKIVPCASVPSIYCCNGFYASSGCYSLTKDSSLAQSGYDEKNPLTHNFHRATEFEVGKTQSAHLADLPPRQPREGRLVSQIQFAVSPYYLLPTKSLSFMAFNVDPKMDTFPDLLVIEMMMIS
ncbi:hypothetical protein DV515_00001445, partial [Chloebia gouldiae]